MLIRINSAKGETYVQIDPQTIERIVVGSNGGASEIHFTDATHYLLPTDEARRIVDLLRARDDRDWKP